MFISAINLNKEAAKGRDSSNLSPKEVFLWTAWKTIGRDKQKGFGSMLLLFCLYSWDNFLLCNPHNLEFLQILDWLHTHGNLPAWILEAGNIGTIILSLSLWVFLLLFFFFYSQFRNCISSHWNPPYLCHNYLCSCFPN